MTGGSALQRVQSVGPLTLSALGALACLVARWWSAPLISGAVLVAGALLWWTVLLILRARARQASSFRIRWSRAVGLVVAVGAFTFARTPGAVLAVLAGVVLLIVVTWWVRLGRIAEQAALRVANVPGVPSAPPTPRVAPGWAAVALLAAMVIGFGAAVAGAGWWGWLGPVAAGTAAILLVGVPWLPVKKAYDQTISALNDLQPVFAMPYNGVAIFHLEMWLPYLQRAGRPIVLITTFPQTFERLARAYRIPLVCSAEPTRQSVAEVLPRTVRAAFYVHNRENREFLALRYVTHVFLHHGDGDKPASSNPISTRYDVLVVAGQAAIDRYARRGVAVPREKFQILGRPQTEAIRTVTRPISSVEHPVVLYAPTWWGGSTDQNFSSLEIGEQIVQALLDRGATVIFRPHPAGRGHPPHTAAITAIKKLLATDAELTGRKHVSGAQAERKWSVADVANRADAMVADVSGIVTDFMQTLKPFAMVATTTDTAGFRTEYPTSQSAYVIEGVAVAEGTDVTLHRSIEEMLGDDPLAGVREERRRYYLGGFEGDGSARAFVDYVVGLAT